MFYENRDLFTGLDFVLGKLSKGPSPIKLKEVVVNGKKYI
jgi:hypothetical protein